MIKKLGDPILREKAKPIEKADNQIKELADLMVEALVKNKAYGIAAPQVGVSKKMIVVDVEDFFHLLINPLVSARSQEDESSFEGCLSIPGVEAEVKRASKVTIKAKDMEGKPKVLSASGLLARVLQHEIDHLEGILFIDHLGDAKRNQLLKEYERNKNSSQGKVETAL